MRQSGICRQRIDGSSTHIVVHKVPIETEAERIQHLLRKNVIFFERYGLTLCKGTEEHVVQAIWRGKGRAVEQIRTRQAVLVRQFVIDANRKEIFINDLLARKGVKTYIPARIRDKTSIGWVIETQVSRR